MRCKDLLHQNKTLTVGPKRAGTHDKRATSLSSAHTQVCARDNKFVTCLDGLCKDRSLIDTDRESSVTKLCPASTATQPLIPTNTQTISLPGHYFPFHHLYFSSDNNAVIYFLSLASDRQSLDFYRSPVAQHSTRSCHTSKTHRIKIYMQVGFIQHLET